MILATGTNSAGLSRRSRFFAAIVGFGLLAILLLASQLQADPRGMGTHEQLGLPRCTFLAWFGKRCPACGMTTAWTHLAQGRPVEAMRTHATGTLLAIATLVAAGFALAMGVFGKRLAWQPGETTIAGLAVVMVALILCEWTWRLWTG